MPRLESAAGSPGWRDRTLADWLWLAFLTWTAIGFVVLPLNIGERQMQAWCGNGPLLACGMDFLHQADAIWMLLAAGTVYLQTAADCGIGAARRSAVIILAASACFEWIGVRTGLPFGPYRYTDRFGWRIGGVLPAAIPLAWLVILLCGRYVVRAIRPQATRLELAVEVAAIALLTDLNLEFVAWKVRGYWTWYPERCGTLVPLWPPFENYASWFLLSFLLAFALPKNDLSPARRHGLTRPICILALMNLLFAVAQLFYWRRQMPPPT